MSHEPNLVLPSLSRVTWGSDQIESSPVVAPKGGLGGLQPLSESARPPLGKFLHLSRKIDENLREFKLWKLGLCCHFHSFFLQKGIRREKFHPQIAGNGICMTLHFKIFPGKYTVPTAATLKKLEPSIGEHSRIPMVFAMIARRRSNHSEYPGNEVAGNIAAPSENFWRRHWSSQSQWLNSSQVKSVA